MEKLRAETITNIRACLISVKGNLELRQLLKDYSQLMGCEIPYRKLSFHTLEDFLRSEPSLIVSHRYDGQTVVDARANDKTAHISEMVARQKATKKRLPVRSTYRPQFRNHHTPSHSQNQNRNPYLGNNWRPKNVSNRWPSDFRSSTRPATMSHNQFVNISNGPSQPPARQQQTVRAKPLAVNHNNNIPKETATAKPPAAKPEPSHRLNLKFSPPLVTTPAPVTPQVPKPVAQPAPKPKPSRPEEERVPNSIKTNRQIMMQKLGVVRTPSPAAIETLKKEAYHAVDAEDPMWSKWTSGSESDSSASQQEKFFVSSGDFEADLMAFAKFHNVEEPVMKIHKKQSKPHKPIFYICHVKVDGESFSSYPTDCYDEKSCKQIACEQAYNKLVQKYGTSNKQKMLLSNESDILLRVPPLVQKHYTGVWSWQVEADYKDLYGEQLPANWLEVLNASLNITMEAYERKYVLNYCRPEDQLQKGKMNSLPLSYEVSIPTSRINFNDQTEFLAEVTCPVSAKEIWCRQIQTREAEAFETMLAKMEETYNRDMQSNRSMRALKVVDGAYYAAWIEGSWFRVRVLNVSDDGVQCLLVDTGDDKLVLQDNIYHLYREFGREQCQAFVCRLEGLEDLYEVSIGSEHLINLEGMRVRIVPCIDENQNSEFDPICVTFYDDENGEIINQELMSLITIENALPTLDETVLNEVYISYIDPETSDIFIQIRSLGFEKLEILLAELEEYMMTTTDNIPVEAITVESNPSTLYYMKMSDDDRHYRVRINDWSPCNTFVELTYVDVGRKDVARVDSTLFHPLDELNSVVSRYPEQALRVRMDLEKTPKDFVQQMQNFCPEGHPVLMRVVRGTDVPIVKLFVRINNGFFSVNESILVSLEPRTKDINTKFNLSTKMMKLKMTIPSTGNLKSPVLPPVGQFFDVNIPAAVNPYNFFVQPYSSKDKLFTLMRDLQARFEDQPAKVVKPNFEVVEGGIYASVYSGKWYRTSVIKVINPSSISVFYCDFGHYSIVKLGELYPLDPQFLELPYQAIKAKLTGIKPREGKWSVNDCNYFTKLVTKKPFVSVLNSIDTDELYKSDCILGLKLYDTSTDRDIDIDEMLVKKKIAVLA